MVGGPGPGAEAPEPLDRGSPMPLWAQLNADLSRRLEAGDFTDAFPGELALAEEYQVSRHTVRAALQRLRADGIVVAGRGRRPRVAEHPPITQPLGTLYSLFAAVESTGLQQTSVINARELRTDAAAAQQLGLDGDAPLFCLERLRLAGDEPLALDTVWLPADIGRSLLDSDFSHTALYEELRVRTGVRLQEGREHIRALVPTPTQRRRLGITPTTGVLEIQRIGRAHGRPLEFRHTLIRGDRFTLLAEFSPNGYQLTHPYAEGLDAGDT